MTQLHLDSMKVIRNEANSGMLTKLSTLETALTSAIARHKGSGTEMSQADALELQYRLQSYNIYASTLATINKDVSDMIKGVLAKV